MGYFEIGIKEFNSSNYNEAASNFSLALEDEKDNINAAMIHLWLGKCYFESYEKYTFRYRVMESVGKGPYQLLSPGHYEIGNSTRRMSRAAIEQFNAAISADDSLAEAYYCKGEAQLYQEEINAAYESCILAARRSSSDLYLNKCYTLFSEYKSLSFISVRDFESIPIETAIGSLNHASAYVRMESCLALSNLLEREVTDAETKNIIKSSISGIAGCKLFFWSVPFTGDVDSRVKNVARTIIDKINSSPNGLYSRVS